MRFTLPALLLVLLAQTTQAALPPRVQNGKDLDVMLRYISEHEQVLATLDSINLHDYTVHYRQGCTAFFGREFRFRMPGWVGPAAPLEFKRTSCPED